jgi:hypothetical protein
MARLRSIEDLGAWLIAFPRREIKSNCRAHSRAFRPGRKKVEFNPFTG